MTDKPLSRNCELSSLEQEGLLESVLSVVAHDMRVAAKTDIQRLMVASYNDGIRFAQSETPRVREPGENRCPNCGVSLE